MPISSYKIAVSVNIVVFAIFAFAGLLIVKIVDRHVSASAIAEAEAKAHILLARYLETHSYFASELKPSVFELTDVSRPKDYFEPAWISSTYAVKKTIKIFMAGPARPDPGQSRTGPLFAEPPEYPYTVNDSSGTG